MTRPSFDIRITTDELTGKLLSVYFQIRRGKSHQTIEFVNGKAFADYNAFGELLGIELLGPCSVSIVDKIAANETPTVRAQTKRFMKTTGPRKMVAA